MQTGMQGVISRLVQKVSSGNTLFRGDQAKSDGVFFVGDNKLLVKIVVNGKAILYYVDANDKLITPWFVANRTYEKAPTRFFVANLKSDSHCIDAGSNFGYFATLMGSLAPQGKVIAIEANESLAALARDNVVVNNLIDRVQVLHAAVSKDNEDVVLFRRIGRLGNTSITHCGEHFTTLLGEPAEEQFRLKGLRIDDLLDSLDGRVDFMKIDVEGAEPLAFAGAAKTIATNPQLNIVMEWSPGQIRSAGFDVGVFLEELESMGLRPFALRKLGSSPLSFGDVLNLPYQAGLLLKRP